MKRCGAKHIQRQAGALADGTADLAVRVIVRSDWAEVVGALLREELGPYAEEPGEEALDLERAEVCGDHSRGSDRVEEVALVFYPHSAGLLTDEDILALLPSRTRRGSGARIQRCLVARDWVDGWRDHFHPVIVGRVRIRPPWEEAVEEPEGGSSSGSNYGASRDSSSSRGSGLVDVVIDPGLAFGTGLHPTTRGTLGVLQEVTRASLDEGGGEGPTQAILPGPLVDVGTGSGVLAIAAAKLGWGPIVAFDNDAVALASARQNVAENGVHDRIDVYEREVEDASLSWFAGATVLANMTLGPVSTLLHMLAAAPPICMVVSGILSGAQETQLVREAESCGLFPGRRVYEAEWVSMALFPITQDAGP